MGDYKPPGTQVNGWTLLAGNTKADWDWAMAHPKPPVAMSQKELEKHNWFAESTPATSPDWVTARQPSGSAAPPPAGSLNMVTMRGPGITTLPGGLTGGQLVTPRGPGITAPDASQPAHVPYFWETPEFRKEYGTAVPSSDLMGMIKAAGQEEKARVASQVSQEETYRRDEVPSETGIPGRYLYLDANGKPTQTPTAIPLYWDSKKGEFTPVRIGDSNRAVVQFGGAPGSKASFQVALIKQGYPISDFDGWNKFLDEQEKATKDAQAKATTEAAVAQQKMSDLDPNSMFDVTSAPSQGMGIVVENEAPDTPIYYMEGLNGPMPIQLAPNASAYWIGELKALSIGQVAVEQGPLRNPFLDWIAAGLNLIGDAKRNTTIRIAQEWAEFTHDKDAIARLERTAYNPITLEFLSEEQIQARMILGAPVAWAPKGAINQARYLRSRDAYLRVSQGLAEGISEAANEPYYSPYSRLNLDPATRAKTALDLEQLINDHTAERESARRQALSYKKQADEAMRRGDTNYIDYVNKALALIRQAQSLDYIDRPYDPYAAWSWGAEPERKEMFLNAVAQLEYQTGAPLKSWQIQQVADRFTDPGLEMSMGIVFDLTNYLPIPFIDDLFRNLGIKFAGKWKALVQAGKWADEANSSAAAVAYRWFAGKATESQGAMITRMLHEPFDMIGTRHGSLSGGESEELFHALDLIDEAATGDIRNITQMSAALSGSPRHAGQIMRAVEVLKGQSTRIKNMIRDKLVSEQAGELMLKQLNAVMPGKWADMARKAFRNLMQVELDRLITSEFRRMVRAGEARELTQELLGALTEKFTESAYRKVNARRVLYAVAGDVRDGFMRAARVERGLNLYNDSVLFQFLARTHLWDNTGLKAFARGSVRFTTGVRNFWTFSTLALRPAWLARNAVDTIFRMTLGAPGSLTTMAQFYKILKTISDDMLIPAAARSSFTSQFSDLERNVVDAVIRGEIKPKEPFSLMKLEWDDLAKKAGTRRGLNKFFGRGVDAVKAFGRGFEDMNSVLEFAARTSKLWELYAPVYKRMAQAEISQLLSRALSMGGTERVASYLQILWDVSGHKPTVMEGMLSRLLGEGSDSMLSVFTDRSLMAALQDMPVELQERLIVSILTDMEHNIAEATRLGKTFDADEYFATVAGRLGAELKERGDLLAALKGAIPEATTIPVRTVPPITMADVARGTLEEPSDVAYHCFDLGIDPNTKTWSNADEMQEALQLGDDELIEFQTKGWIETEVGGPNAGRVSLSGEIKDAYTNRVMSSAGPEGGPAVATAFDPEAEIKADADSARRLNEQADLEDINEPLPDGSKRERVAINERYTKALKGWDLRQARVRATLDAAKSKAVEGSQEALNFFTDVNNKLVDASTRIRRFFKYVWPGPLAEGVPIEVVRHLWNIYNPLAAQVQDGINLLFDNLMEMGAKSGAQAYNGPLQLIFDTANMRLEWGETALTGIQFLDDLGEPIKFASIRRTAYLNRFLSDMFGGEYIHVALRDYLPDGALRRLIEEIPYSRQLVVDIQSLAQTGVVRPGSALEAFFPDEVASSQARAAAAGITPQSSKKTLVISFDQVRGPRADMSITLPSDVQGSVYNQPLIGRRGVIQIWDARPEFRERTLLQVVDQAKKFAESEGAGVEIVAVEEVSDAIVNVNHGYGPTPTVAQTGAYIEPVFDIIVPDIENALPVGKSFVIQDAVEDALLEVEQPLAHSYIARVRERTGVPNGAVQISTSLDHNVLEEMAVERGYILSGTDEIIRRNLHPSAKPAGEWPDIEGIDVVSDAERTEWLRQISEERDVVSSGLATTIESISTAVPEDEIAPIMKLRIRDMISGDPLSAPDVAWTNGWVRELHENGQISDELLQEWEGAYAAWQDVSLSFDENLAAANTLMDESVEAGVRGRARLIRDISERINTADTVLDDEARSALDRILAGVEDGDVDADDVRRLERWIDDYGTNDEKLRALQLKNHEANQVAHLDVVREMGRGSRTVVFEPGTPEYRARWTETQNEQHGLWLMPDGRIARRAGMHNPDALAAIYGVDSIAEGVSGDEINIYAARHRYARATIMLDINGRRFAGIELGTDPTPAQVMAIKELVESGCRVTVTWTSPLSGDMMSNLFDTVTDAVLDPAEDFMRVFVSSRREFVKALEEVLREGQEVVDVGRMGTEILQDHLKPRVVRPSDVTVHMDGQGIRVMYDRSRSNLYDYETFRRTVNQAVSKLEERRWINPGSSREFPARVSRIRQAGDQLSVESGRPARWAGYDDYRGWAAGRAEPRKGGPLRTYLEESGVLSPPLERQRAIARDLWSKGFVNEVRGDGSTLAKFYNGISYKGHPVLESPEVFRAYLVDSIQAAKSGGWSPSMVQAMEEHLLYLDNFLSTAKANWAALGAPMPKGYKGYGAVGPSRRLLNRGTATWLLGNQDALARHARLIDFLDKWRLATKAKLAASPVLGQALSPEELEVLAKVGKEAVARKGDIIGIAMNGGEHQALGGTWAGALPQVNESMLDYGDFTRLDKFAKSIWPFWMFPSRSTAFWGKYMLSHPWLPAMYGKYMDWTKRSLVQGGYYNTQGDPIPSKIGMMRIPGTDIWFNPLGPLSFRYPIMLFDRLANGDSEEFSELDPWPAFWTRFAKISRVAGLDLPPWTYFAMTATGMIDSRQLPSYPLFAPLQLVPRTYLLSTLEKILHIDQGKLDFLHPDVSWKDYLIEVRMYEDLLRRLNGVTDETKIRAIINDAKDALGYTDDPDDKSGTGLGYYLSPREDDPYWRKISAEVEKDEYAADMVGYFTGIFPKLGSDGSAVVYAIRNYRNFLRDSINSRATAQVFKLDADAEARYQRYIDDGFKTGWGQVAGLYNNGRFLTVPGPNGKDMQLYGEDRRMAFAKAIHVDEVTLAYYDSWTNLIEARDEELMSGKYPFGSSSPEKDAIWQKYFDAVEALETNPMYKDARREWMIGHKPESMIYEHYRRQFWNILNSTRPEWDQDNQTYDEWMAEIEKWKAELPDLARRYIKSMMANNTFKQTTPGGNEIVVRGNRVNLPSSGSLERYIDLAELSKQLIAEATPEGYEAYRISSATLYTAIDRVYKEMYTNQYFEDMSGLKGFEFEVASQEWLASHKMPTEDEVVKAVMEKYRGRWPEAEIRLAFQKAGAQAMEQRLAPKTETEAKQNRLWDVLLWSQPPNLRNLLEQQLVKLGGDPSSITTWYDTGGEWANVVGDSAQEKFQEFYDKVDRAAKLAGIVQPDKETLKILLQAARENEEFRTDIKDKLGAEFYSYLTQYALTSDKNEKKLLRAEHPEIDIYYDMKDQWAETHPVWAKYYHPDYAGLLTGGTANVSTYGSYSGGRSSSGRGSGGGGGGGGGGGSSQSALGSWVPIGLRTRDLTRLGSGGASSKPIWPRGFVQTVGSVAIEELERLYGQGTPLATATAEYLRRLRSRHPEWKAFLDNVLADQAQVSAQST